MCSLLKICIEFHAASGRARRRQSFAGRPVCRIPKFVIAKQRMERRTENREWFGCRPLAGRRLSNWFSALWSTWESRSTPVVARTSTMGAVIGCCGLLATTYGTKLHGVVGVSGLVCPRPHLIPGDACPIYNPHGHLDDDAGSPKPVPGIPSMPLINVLIRGDRTVRPS